MTLQVGMLLFPQITQLDLTGPFEVLHRLPDSAMHLVWKDARAGRRPRPACACSRRPPSRTARRSTSCSCPADRARPISSTDSAVLDWVSTQGRGARYVTSVCTGSLVLGAAGLLDGYDATTHWAYMDILPMFGARPVRQRVVVDRNRITAGG